MKMRLMLKLFKIISDKYIGGNVKDLDLDLIDLFVIYNIELVILVIFWGVLLSKIS